MRRWLGGVVCSSRVRPYRRPRAHWLRSVAGNAVAVTQRVNTSETGAGELQKGRWGARGCAGQTGTRVSKARNAAVYQFATDSSRGNLRRTGSRSSTSLRHWIHYLHTTAWFLHKIAIDVLLPVESITNILTDIISAWSFISLSAAIVVVWIWQRARVRILAHMNVVLKSVGDLLALRLTSEN